MTKTVCIDVEYVRRLREELAAFNKLDLNEIEFYENGRKIEIAPQALEEWSFVGLNNADFIMTDLYKEQTIFTVDSDEDDEDDEED
jgi:hypothetical protein